METNRKLMVLGVLFLVGNMIVATQYATTKVGYEYSIVHPSDAEIRFIGSDNTTGGRVLRVDGTNGTSSLKLTLGNWSAGVNKIYSAAFGIVNEEQVSVDIKYINVSAVNYTYLRIWLHGDRDANANSTTNDPTTVLMFNNGTVVNASNTTAWTLAPGDGDSSDMCSNVSNRLLYSSNTTWDNTSHVRYSFNDSVGYGVGMSGRTVSNASDFVWIQVAIDIPNDVDIAGSHAGTIYIHFESDTNS